MKNKNFTHYRSKSIWKELEKEAKKEQEKKLVKEEKFQAVLQKLPSGGIRWVFPKAINIGPKDELKFNTETGEGVVRRNVIREEG